jgi:hypothetical protein
MELKLTPAQMRALADARKHLIFVSRKYQERFLDRLVNLKLLEPTICGGGVYYRPTPKGFRELARRELKP